jgi:hypothetical protein
MKQNSKHLKNKPQKLRNRTVSILNNSQKLRNRTVSILINYKNYEIEL